MLIENLSIVKDMKEKVFDIVPYVKFLGQTGEVTTPTITVMIDKVGVLKSELTDLSEEMMFAQLLTAASEFTVQSSKLEDGLLLGLEAVYDRTKRYIPNIIVANTDNKKELKKALKGYGEHEVIYSNLLPKNTYLMSVKSADGMTAPAVLFRGNSGTKLVIVNPLLMVKVVINPVEIKKE